MIVITTTRVEARRAPAGWPHLSRLRACPHPAPTRRVAKDMRQSVDRNHQDALLDPLDAPRADGAHDAPGRRYLLAFCRYRYRDSNPGFRRERAAS